MKRRCAIYTRKSSEEGLEQAFNSLHAQREACEAFVKSQRHEGWTLISSEYDDGGYSGGTMARPGLTRLLSDIDQGLVDVVVVYKVDRLSRSLADFVKLVDAFDKKNVSFVSVTQQFNTSTSMGRLTLNVLLSFAQFEREVTGERIRDKIAASKKKGLWMGGVVPLGYRLKERALVVDDAEAKTVREVYAQYLAKGSVRELKLLDEKGVGGRAGRPFSRGALYTLLRNPIYIGKVRHKGVLHEGQQAAIVDLGLWEKVQTALAAHCHARKTGAAARDPSRLAGLIFDDRGHPMSPSHATKGSRRYRYYVSQAVLHGKEDSAGSVVRINAAEIEQPILAKLKEIVSTPACLFSALGQRDLTADQQKRMIERGRRWATHLEETAVPEQIAVLRKIIKRIVLERAQVRLTLSKRGLSAVLGNTPISEETDPTDDAYEIVMPASLQRCGIETKLIIADDVPPAHARTLQALRAALGKALEWNEALLSGEVASMAEIAKKEGVTQRYIAHLLRLAYLAPEVMTAIFKGQAPVTLSLARLKRPFPLEWNAQRTALGFTG